MSFPQLLCCESHLPGHKHPCHLPGCPRHMSQSGRAGRSTGRCPRISPTSQEGSSCVSVPPLAAEPHPIAYISKLKQPYEAFKVHFGWLNQGKMWCLSSFFLFASFSVFFRTFLVWVGGCSSDSQPFMIYSWDLTSTAWFSTPVRNITMFSEVCQEYLRGKVT